MYVCMYVCMYVTSAIVHYCDPRRCVEPHIHLRRRVDLTRLGFGGEHSETGRNIQGQESGMYVCMYVYMYVNNINCSVFIYGDHVCIYVCL